LRVTVCCLVAGLGASAWVVAASGRNERSGGQVVLQPGADLPDLGEAVPDQLRVLRLREAGQTFYALAFQTVAQNLASEGNAELYVVGHRADTRVPTMSADQYINVRSRDGGSIVAQQVVPNVGQLIFQRRLAGHDHWHFVGFETYSLFREPGSRLFSRDSKVGFCITSEVPVRAVRAKASAAQPAGLISYTDDTRGCGAHQPGLTRVIESLNPRTGDSYGPGLGGQNVDITDAPNGQYVLVIRVNPADRLIESNYKNDFASLRLSIRRAKRGALPSIRVIRRCPGVRVCNL
jgi:hypothetical protein